MFDIILTLLCLMFGSTGKASEADLLVSLPSNPVQITLVDRNGGIDVQISVPATAGTGGSIFITNAAPAAAGQDQPYTRGTQSTIPNRTNQTLTGHVSLFLFNTEQPPPKWPPLSWKQTEVNPSNTMMGSDGVLRHEYTVHLSTLTGLGSTQQFNRGTLRIEVVTRELASNGGGVTRLRRNYFSNRNNSPCALLLAM